MTTHPFLENTEHPIWSALQPQCVRSDITLALEQSEKNLEVIRELNPRDITFENTIKALEQATVQLDEAWGLVAHLCLL